MNPSVNPTNLDALVGWSIGRTFAVTKKAENEIKQGKSYAIAGLYQWGEITSLANIIDKISVKILAAPAIARCNIIKNTVVVLSLPLCILSGIIKQGSYKEFANCWNSCKYTPFTLPLEPGKGIINFSNFFSEHIGDITTVSMVAGSAALIALGNPVFGAATLLPLIFETADNAGLVPYKVSLFMEKYAPTISNIGILIGGNTISQLISAAVLSSYIGPTSISRALQHRADALAKKIFVFEGPTLAEFESPLPAVNKHLKFDEIQDILHSNNEFELNPAHYKEWVIDPSSFPENRNFEKYLDIFDTIAWENKYAIIFPKLRDDDRFIDWISQKFPGIDKEVITRDCEHYILQISEDKANVAATYLRHQIVCFVDILQNKRPVQGSKQELEIAKVNCAKILYYLERVELPVEREDILLKLAVEAGDYCALGIKRTSDELMSMISYNAAANRQNQVDADQENSFEMSLKQKLLSKRVALFQQYYVELTSNFLDNLKQNVHFMTQFKWKLALGFLPMTNDERNSLGLLDIYYWSTMFAPLRQYMLDDYKKSIEDAFKEAGNFHFFNYFRTILHTNPKLTEQEKETIDELVIYRNNNLWTSEETQERFHRLALVMLGIMRKKA